MISAWACTVLACFDNPRIYADRIEIHRDVAASDGTHQPKTGTQGIEWCGEKSGTHHKLPLHRRNSVVQLLHHKRSLPQRDRISQPRPAVVSRKSERAILEAHILQRNLTALITQTRADERHVFPANAIQC